ncbi:hypothetical protein BC831DRAFT_415690 [Entophlyctis helioformis]|nr:hypothetical protein BC831DRAFT_415690 [Entophlyctis helioformis]
MSGHELDDADAAAQEGEVLALQAIYDDKFVLETTPQGKVTGFLEVPITLWEPLALELSSAADASGAVPAGTSNGTTSSTTARPSASGDPISSATNDMARLALSHVDSSASPAVPTEVIHHLPSVVIRFQVPKGYPSRQCLVFVLDCPWLSSQQIIAVKSHLVDLWKQDKDVVLFRFAEFLANEMLDMLGLIIPTPTSASSEPVAAANMLNISRDLPDRHVLVESILETDAAVKQREFDENRFDCGVCFESKRGYDCYQFRRCGHVYCRDCLVDYFTMLISEGSVSFVGCLDSACKKHAATEAATASRMSEKDLQRLLPEDLVVRFQDLVIKKDLESRTDVTYCPRPMCQSPVIRSNIEKDPKLCVCTACSYAFCFFCRRGWHGYAEYCQISNLIRVVQQYTAETTSAAQRTEMEQRYGKKVLERIVKQVLDEQASRDWIKENGQMCPQCEAFVQKSDGCNHIQCGACNAHFCYLCGELLDKARPYAHFNDPKSFCYGLLFAGLDEAPDRANGNVGGGGDGGGGAEEEYVYDEDADMHMNFLEQMARQG